MILLLPFLFLWWLAWIAVFTWAGYTIGQPKNRQTEGLLFGFFGGILGVLVTYMLPAKVSTPVQWTPSVPGPGGWR